uniref:GATA zinc finger domain-containing protein 1 n=1 Tax=Ornithodoros turicata TaxID=34597 RepID=A0A2R5L685_9ACAR
MPFGLKPVCATCKASVSSMWRKNESGEVVCNSCAVRVSASTESEPASQKDNNGSSCPFTLRKSTRAKSSKLKHQQQQMKAAAPKGKGRRVIFKRGPLKAPAAVATCVTSDFVFFRDTYYQVGDVVSMMDENEDVYYGQIRGLLQDQYCEKSAVITWLIPTKGSPKTHFDPSTYILGPEEEVPRKLECMSFVCHAPSEYFKAKNTPYRMKPSGPESCFIWTRLGPQVRPLPTQEQVFGPA